MNREDWLANAVGKMRPWLEDQGFPLPEIIQVSCGWPKTQGKKNKQHGQTFDGSWSKDGRCQIFISPSLEDKYAILNVLLRELCHAAVGPNVGNSGPFLKAIRAVGMSGKATEATARVGTSLYADMVGLAEGVLGDYPHSAMINRRLAPTRLPGGGWVKFRSKLMGDKYILRVSPKSLADHGPPRGPSGEEMEKCA